MCGHDWLHGSRAQDAISPVYAESCMVVGLSADGAQEISLRLARFPAKNEGALWVTVCDDKDVWCVVVEGVPLGALRERTMVENSTVRFELTGKDRGWMTRTRRDSLQGASEASVGAHFSMMPPSGRGPIPLIVEARFESRHRPVNARPGRTEVMGRTQAIVRTPGRTLKFEGAGKWHEQVGDRPRFAPAFTYLSAMNERSGLLATKIPNGAFGYAWMDKEIVMVKAMEIDPISPKRSFRVTLEDGRVIASEAITRRVIALPIEGQRRPGATVTVKSDLGALVGHLNDWQPEKT